MHRFSILSERGMVFNRVPKMLLTGAQIYKTILKHCPIHAISQTLSKRLRGSFKETASNSTNVKRKKTNACGLQTLQACHSPNGIGPDHQLCWRRFAQDTLLHIGNLMWPNLASRIQWETFPQKSGSHFLSPATKPSNMQERPKADMPRHHREGIPQPAPGLKQPLRDQDCRIATQDPAVT